MRYCLLLSVILLYSCTNENCCDELVELRTQIEVSKSIRSYNDYIPLAPPFHIASWGSFDFNIFSEGCSQQELADTLYILNYPDWEATRTHIHFQDASGVRYKAVIDKHNSSNVDMSWLPYILIPGQKVEVIFEVCGSGGFLNILKLTNLPRN
jgi:hypothetical protein